MDSATLHLLTFLGLLDEVIIITILKKLFMYHGIKLSLISRERGMWHEKARSQNCRGHKRAARVLAVASVSGL